MTTEIRKCKNPKCGKQFEIDIISKHSLRKVYCCVPCKNEHYRNTHKEYYRQMATKSNWDKAHNPKYAEINGRIRYVSKADRELRDRAKLIDGLNKTFMDTDSCDQGAYL